ncbi:metallopeptidase family protein [Candidatus Peregrinibacteria bacterium]|nr:metallopeptidase family protein [Candidatus Peregrinibacteria bacterium]
MELDRFEKLVDEALREFPKKLRDAIGNVAIVIEAFPRSKKVGEIEITHGTILLGLYEGVPQSTWGRNQGGIPPDKITVFQGSIESIAKSESDLKKLARDVVWHELGHHFGFGEDDLRKIEERRRK